MKATDMYSKPEFVGNTADIGIRLNAIGFRPQPLGFQKR
jgi:hypothetical protein